MSIDARPHRRPARGRALFAFGAAATCVAAGLVFVAFRGDTSEATLQVDDARAATLPITVPPVLAAPTQTAPPITSPVADDPEPSATATTAPSAPTTTVTTTTISPLAALVGDRGSAVPTPFVPRARPTGLVIDDLDLLGEVREVGLRSDGALEVPDATEIGWYKYGAAPGHEGATVLAAHVSWNGDLGPFRQLGDLEPGARVEVGLDDGTERIYEVIERTMYDKDALPRERIWRNTGPETLVLITCGGDFNPEISRYRQNIVVYAVPVA